MTPRSHLELVADITPSSPGCEDCPRIGGRWVHLRRADHDLDLAKGWWNTDA